MTQLPGTQYQLVKSDVEQLIANVASSTESSDAATTAANAATSQALATLAEATTEADRADAAALSADGHADRAELAETNIQSNTVFQDMQAISETLSETFVKFIWGTVDDDDLPDWVHRMASRAWMNEPLNTAIRGARRELPRSWAVGLRQDETIIYDATGASLAMWMVFNKGSSLNMLMQGTSTSISFKNGVLTVGCGSDMYVADFVCDEGRQHSVAGISGFYKGNIAQRNDALGFTVDGAVKNLASRVINTVVMGLDPSAPFDRDGMRTPTINAVTDSGVSVVLYTGDVVNVLTSLGPMRDADALRGGGLAVTGGEGVGWGSYVFNTTPTADAQSADFIFNESSIPVRLGLDGTTGEVGSISAFGEGFSVALTQLDAVQSVVYNPSDPAKSFTSIITSDYNTGYMLGDVTFSVLCDTVVGSATGAGSILDRSVNANHLDVDGVVAKVSAATGSEVVAYGPFDINNCPRIPMGAMDFGAAKFLVSVWLKGTQRVINILDTRDGAGAGFGVGFTSSSFALPFVWRGTGNRAGSANVNVVDSNQWVKVDYLLSGSRTDLYLNGVFTDSFDGIIDTGVATTDGYIGVGYDGTRPISNGRLAMLRVGPGWPSAEQIAYAYHQELQLFKEGAKATLQGVGTTITGLDYDVRSDLRYIAQPDGYNVVSGLTVVDWVAADCTGGVSVDRGHVAAIGAAEASLTGPAINLRERALAAQPTPTPNADFTFEFDGNDERVTLEGVTATARLPQGWKPLKVWVDGMREREGTGNDFRFQHDGFVSSVYWPIAPGSAAFAQVEAEAIT